jgi:phosphatidylglycerophosphatase C
MNWVLCAIYAAIRGRLYDFPLAGKLPENGCKGYSLGISHRHSMMTTPVVALFDFDHTLTKSDSFAGFCRWLLRRQWWRLTIVVVASPFLAPLLLLKSSRRMPVRFAVWVATLGVTDEQLPQLVRSYLQTHLAAAASIVSQDGLDRVAMHRKSGHDVIIATGALELLARAICDAAGLQDIVVVGSSLRRFLGGWVSDQHCFGARKIPMLAQRGYPPDWEFVYTDHHADVPILARAKQRFLVNPRRQTIIRVTAALGVTPPILKWT